MHRLGRLCTLCMVRLSPPAWTEQDRAPQIHPAGPAAGRAPASAPRRHRLRFYSALAGRARAGWLQGREEEGGTGWVGNGTNPGVAMAIGRGCRSP